MATIALTVVILVVVVTSVVALVASWKVIALAAGLGMLAIAFAVVNLAIRRSRAIEQQRAFVDALPFPFPDYLETMRQPRWWSAFNHFVRYEPDLIVTWKTDPDREIVAKLCTLAKAKVAFDDKQPTRATIEETGWTPDPWKWARNVVHEVLIPLQERTQVANVGLEIKRSVEERTGD